ncbi:superinfection immunity protein [Streptomyces sp. NPDC002790]|uniref:superinfection immunity protein n=1 Tax=Streptomyces sp. NPDC002790 TaxID=3154431 RepID=UPI00331B86A3
MFAKIGTLEVLILALIALIVLVVPSFIAHRRRVQRLGLVIGINVIGAFTGVFWFVALVMALTMATREPELTGK